MKKERKGSLVHCSRSQKAFQSPADHIEVLLSDSLHSGANNWMGMGRAGVVLGIPSAWPLLNKSSLHSIRAQR